MIQRIQTLYLFLIVVLMVALCFLPLAVVEVGGMFYEWNVVGLCPMVNTGEVAYISIMWELLGVAIATALIALVSIFLFSRRILQMRLSMFNMFLLLGFYGLFAFRTYAMDGSVEADVEISSYGFALCFPFICCVLNYLAIRGIGADEALVRSLDRLR